MFLEGIILFPGTFGNRMGNFSEKTGRDGDKIFTENKKISCIFVFNLLLYKPMPIRAICHFYYGEEVQLMAKCDFCGKGVTFGIKVSHSHRRSNKAWKPNVKRVKAIVDGTPRHVYVCTRCLRSGKVTRAV